MKSAERSTKWCHSNDEETGDNDVQRLSMLSNTAEQKAYVTPTAIYSAWCTQRSKKERRPGFAQLNEPCCATHRPPPSPRGVRRPPLGGNTVLRRQRRRRPADFFLIFFIGITQISTVQSDCFLQHMAFRLRRLSAHSDDFARMRKYSLPDQ